MITIKTTSNLYGVTLMGDYEDLDKLYDSLSNYLSFFINNADYYPYHEYEYLLSLNYDIRHCYMETGAMKPLRTGQTDSGNGQATGKAMA